MESTSADVLSVLRSHAWSAGLHWYDYLQWVQFGMDGSGFMSQGAGQSIKVEARFRYSVPRLGRLHLEFLDTPSCYCAEDLAFERTEGNAIRDVVFDLIPVPHAVGCATMGGMVRRGFAWLLRFHSEPFPVGYEPSVTLLDYYGRPLRADDVRQTFG
jgi:hypothetical protein